MKLVLIEDHPMAHDFLSLTVFDGRTPVAYGEIELNKSTTRSGLIEVIEEFRTAKNETNN